MIYLDNAATTFPKSEEVYKEMDITNRNLAVNAGRGSYKLAKEATKLIDDTKELLLKLIAAPDYSKVVFTPSATIAMNEILGGLILNDNDVVYVSPFEHNAVARMLNLISKKRKIKIIELPINSTTYEIDIEKMKYQFSKERPVCVCCTHISNVIGYILPIKEIFELAKEYEAITIMDAAQSMGLVPIELRNLKADFVVFAGHKTLYGPFGVAGFIDVHGVDLEEYIVGGTGSDSLNLEMPQKSPNKYESASINVVAVAGLMKSLDEMNIDYIYSHEKHVSDYLVNSLKKIKGIVLYLPGNLSECHISIVSFNIEGYKAEDIGMFLDEDYNIAVRTGYHCAPWVHKYLNNQRYAGTVRVGIGKFTTIQDIDVLAKALEEITEG